MTLGRLLGRALRSRRVRAWLAVAGVATCTLLVLALAGAFHSVQHSMTSYVDQPGADLWLAPPGADNLIRGSFSALVPLAYADSVRTQAGVRQVQPVLKAFLPVKPLGDTSASRRVTLLAIGYRVPDGLGGPPAFSEGRAPKGWRQLALDRAAALRLGVAVGDTVVLGNRKVAVSGVTRGTNILATQFMFADFDAAAAIAGVKGEASFLVVQLAPHADPDSIARALEDRFPEFSVYTRSRFVANNQREVSAGFLPLLSLIAGLGVVAAAVLVGLLVHGVVEERRAEIAVLLALGADAAAVGGGVVRHALSLVTLGVLAGAALAWALAAALDYAMPLIPLEVAGRDALGISLVFLLTGLLAALVPVLLLRRVDPLEAFRP
ncbi:MAG: ABC transporter permease [Deltaproteobacteria bacterium]